MPIYEYYCEECKRNFESLVRNMEDEPASCPYCECKAIYKAITAHGGYSIKGNNGGSTKGKYNGSFKRSPK